MISSFASPSHAAAAACVDMCAPPLRPARYHDRLLTLIRLAIFVLVLCVGAAALILIANFAPSTTERCAAVYEMNTSAPYADTVPHPQC